MDTRPHLYFPGVHIGDPEGDDVKKYYCDLKTEHPEIPMREIIEIED
jgi:hypothetical protein